LHPIRVAGTGTTNYEHSHSWRDIRGTFVISAGDRFDRPGSPGPRVGVPGISDWLALYTVGQKVATVRADFQREWNRSPPPGSHHPAGRSTTNNRAARDQASLQEMTAALMQSFAVALPGTAPAPRSRSERRSIAPFVACATPGFGHAAGCIRHRERRSGNWLDAVWVQLPAPD
jgi:hypothetical protein